MDKQMLGIINAGEENRKLKEALSKFEDKKSNGWDAFFDTKN